MKRELLCVAMVIATTSVVADDSGRDSVMVDLARRSGCFACHHIDPGGKGPEGLLPVGPSWRDVATKYRGRSDALDELTRTVMKGSNPYDSHWKGKASGLAMPPNAVAIKDSDARDLVRWILSLENKS
ncbi:MAG: c-type cytochrome [Burkholderiales bacterium]|nr:c-type cytochrome [Burkholderiales bacterium]